MSDLPKVTDKTIKAHTGLRSFQLGEPYFRQNAVTQTRRIGRTLKAFVQGSASQPYRVVIPFTDTDIGDAECSCPVGSGGHCKHAAAVLIAWQKRPADFVETPDIPTMLDQRSKKELIAVFHQILRRHPELEPLLETLLETPLPVPGEPHKKVIDPQIYRRQAEAAFANIGDEWDAWRGVVAELEQIRLIGEEFENQHDCSGAVAVYRGVAEGIQASYRFSLDEEGDLQEIVDECIEGLGRCLAAEKASPQRELILRAIFDIWSTETEADEMASDAPALIMQNATPEERTKVAGWIREAIASADGHGDWGLREFLFDLEADTLSDEEFLTRAEELDRHEERLRRMLELGRSEEALREIAEGGAWDLTALADLLVEFGFAKEAEQLILKRAQEKTNDPSGYQNTYLLEWLKKRRSARRDTEGVLELAEQIFRQSPTLAEYKEVRKSAEKLGRWEELRPKMQEALKKSGRNDLLIEVHLQEGEIDEALKMVQNKQASVYGGYGGLHLEVAKAAEKERPAAALEIYRQTGEALVHSQGRVNYQAATKHLKKVRDLYRGMGQADEWKAYAEGLREKNKSKRAFLEELEAAGL